MAKRFTLKSSTQPVERTLITPINGGNIVGAAHLFPEEPVSSGKLNKGWIVSHIDLVTWNKVHMYIVRETQLRSNKR